MFILNGKPLPVDTPFTHNGIKYPANWLRLTSWQEKEAIGISEEPDAILHDQRYYWGYDVDGNLIPKDLNQLKEQHIKQTKQNASALLTSTDWYIIRKLERNIDIPINIIEYRESIISFTQQTEDLISNAKTVEELKEVLESRSNWPFL